jgi:hypothetical protein
MIETIVNITTGACYLVTAGVIVKYIYSRFVRHKIIRELIFLW